MPQTRYNVFEIGNSEPLTQCSDMLEADMVIQQLKDANPHKEYKVEQVAVTVTITLAVAEGVLGVRVRV